MEAFVLFHAVGIQGNYRDVAHSSLFQSPADKGHIVAGPAAAAGLGHNNGKLPGIIFSGEHRLHDLSNHRDGGEAGIVVDKFQSHIDGFPVVVVQNRNVIAVFVKYRLQKLKMDGAHLGSQNGVPLQSHFFGKFLTVVIQRLPVGGDPLLPAHIHGRQQRADPDANRA